MKFIIYWNALINACMLVNFKTSIIYKTNYIWNVSGSNPAQYKKKFYRTSVVLKVILACQTVADV